MTETTIDVVADCQSEARSEKIAQQLRQKLTNLAPSATVSLKRSNPRSQSAGEVVVIALSHIAVTGVIECLRLIWDLFHEPLRIRLADGTEMIFRGDSESLERITKLLPEPAADERQRLDP